MWRQRRQLLSREGWRCRWQRDDTCYVCPVNSYNCIGCPDCKYERRPYWGAGEFLFRIHEQRCSWQDEVAAGASTAVVANMGRRMHPAMMLEATPMQLAGQGITMSKYVERFGGYGKGRDFGHVMWQVALIMDHLQMENCKQPWMAPWTWACCCFVSEGPPRGVHQSVPGPFVQGKGFRAASFQGARLNHPEAFGSGWWKIRPREIWLP